MELLAKETLKFETIKIHGHRDGWKFDLSNIVALHTWFCCHLPTFKF